MRFALFSKESCPLIPLNWLPQFQRCLGQIYFQFFYRIAKLICLTIPLPTVWLFFFFFQHLSSAATSIQKKEIRKTKTSCIFGLSHSLFSIPSASMVFLWILNKNNNLSFHKLCFNIKRAIPFLKNTSKNTSKQNK